MYRRPYRTADGLTWQLPPLNHQTIEGGGCECRVSCWLKSAKRDMESRELTRAEELHHADLRAINSKGAPDAVAPVPHPAASIAGRTLRAKLTPLSWNVFPTRPA